MASSSAHMLILPFQIEDHGRKDTVANALIIGVNSASSSAIAFCSGRGGVLRLHIVLINTAHWARTFHAAAPTPSIHTPRKVFRWFVVMDIISNVQGGSKRMELV